MARKNPRRRVKPFDHPDGSIVLLPKLPASAVRDIIKAKRRPVTIEQMNKAIADAATAGAQPAKRR